MIWAILAALGVPLWLCGGAIVTLLVRNRALRQRPGNVPVRIRRTGKKRWRPGHAVWIHDGFVFRALPAACDEALLWAVDAPARPATAKERKKLHRIGDEPVVATLTLVEGETIDVAARSEDWECLLGPFSGSAHPAGVDAAEAVVSERR